MPDELAMSESHAADMLCFSSYVRHCPKAISYLSTLAALHGQRVIKHTHGEFGGGPGLGVEVDEDKLAR